MKKSLFILFSLFWATYSIGAIDALHFQNTQQEASYHKLTQSLRCPQCQNNNIADSNASIAQDMRRKVLDLLQQGQTEQQIVDYMVARYGNFVTYDPPLTLSTLILWLAPLGVLGFALFFLWLPKEQKQAQEKLSTDDTQRLQDLLNEKEK